MVRTLASQREGILILTPTITKVLGSIPGWGWTCLCGVCIFSLCLRLFSLGSPASSCNAKTCRLGQLVTLICYRCECECDWLFVSICQPCDELATCPVCTPPSPSVSWDWLQPPATHQRIINYK